MATIAKPAVRPANPRFSSGPCAKRPGWSPASPQERAARPLASLEARQGAAQARDRRDARGPAKCPADYRIGIVPASDTGAVEMALWSLLGARGVDVLAWESFGDGWVDRRRQAAQARRRARARGALRRAARSGARSISTRDVVFTWNGTTSGVRVPNGDWIAADRDGLTICDATSRRLRAAARLRQARCRHLLLAEGAGRRGGARHADPLAARRRAARDLHAGLAAAEDLPPDQGRQARSRASSRARRSTRRRCCASRTISTRSHWAKSIGGLDGADRARRRQRRASSPTGSRARRGSISSPRDPATRSNTSVCLKIVDPAVAALAAEAQAAFAKALADAAREGGRRLRHRRLSRCAAGPAHLVRRDRRDAPTSRR